jgi:predicted alpha/beta superfamily hydrolase
MKFIYTLIVFLFICQCYFIHLVRCSVLVVDVFYPESSIDLNAASGGNIFSLGYSAYPYSDEAQETASGLYQPWFGNFSIYINNNTNRVGPNHWQKSVDLGRFSGLIYAELAMNPSSFTIPACNSGLNLTGGFCIPRASPYYCNVTSVSANASIVMYPAFNIYGLGNSYTLFDSFYSESLDNTRPINVFVPWSYIENPESRVMNVLVLLDGNLEVLSFMANYAALDMGILSGQFPETIVVGYPPGTNGSACPTDYSTSPPSSTCDQRYYEFTNSVCDPTVSVCSSGASGGGNLTLEFIWEEVLPAVFSKLNLLQGEVSITGYSLGGLMSCYAAGTRPEQFQRAFCMSPSVWYNMADVAQQIQSTFDGNGGILPKSVVMQLGTEEGNSLITTDIPPTVWMDTFQTVMNAWLHIGMGSYTTSPASSSANSSYISSSSAYMTLNSNLVVFNNIGGVHTLTSWADVFSYGLGLLYSPDFPALYAQQRNTHFSLLYPVPPTTTTTVVSSCDGDDDEKDGKENDKNAIVGLSVALVVFVLISCVLAYDKYFGKNSGIKESVKVQLV